VIFMPGWTEKCPLHLNFVVLSVDEFEPPITDGSLLPTKGALNNVPLIC